MRGSGGICDQAKVDKDRTTDTQGKGICTHDKAKKGTKGGPRGETKGIQPPTSATGVLRALATGPPLPVSVLAFSSGAEESNWVAAHAFATTHRWAADYVAVINLEAIGAAGEHIAFQVHPACHSPVPLPPALC